MNLRFALLIVFSALALAGCGNKGPLVQAPPKPAEETPAPEKTDEQAAPPASETPSEPAADPEAAPPATQTAPPAASDGGG